MSSELPFVIKLKLRDIQQAVKEGEKLDSDCLNLAIRNMAREDVENFKNTKCLGWRHYVDSDWTVSSLCGKFLHSCSSGLLNYNALWLFFHRNLWPAEFTPLL